ncbi:MFS transporter [Ruegeria hyattellae]|uniref:MFS transporter n=1 Tax=Ruegeria hyattellae TaxID=3233337 RepID=UPI00355B998B
MTDDLAKVEKRNFPIITGQSTVAQVAWTMASPSIVLTFLAVALDLPVLFVGALVTIRQVAGTLTDIFLYDPISRIRNRKLALSLTDIALGVCFVLAIAAALLGTPPVIMVVFAVVIFVLGLIDESQTLLLTDFISDNLQSRSRMRMKYAQLALGGGIAIALTLTAHEMTKEMPPLHRHSIVITIAILCFMVAGFVTLAVRDTGASIKHGTAPTRSPIAALKDYILNAFDMLKHPWFRKYMSIRLLYVVTILSVPFFALISAETHKHSDKGLTALIVSTAAGAVVSGPLWRTLNNRSHRTVMVSSCLLVAVTGMVLVGAHFLHLDNNVHLHAVSMFVITVAVNGLVTVRGLYYMDLAPKEERVRGVAVSRSLSRLTAIVVSASLAAIAHLHETVWALVMIVGFSILSALFSYIVAKPEPSAQPTSA